MTTKTIKFKPNPQGIEWLEVNMTTWQIVRTCANSMFISQRAFRLTKRGQRIEYRNGSSYSEIPADIESIS